MRRGAHRGIADNDGPLGAALDEYLRIRHTDALQDAERWRHALDAPVPETAPSAEAVLDELIRVVVPNGSAVPRPGAIDPLGAIGEIAREHGVRFHVDGAYELPGLLDGRKAPLHDGLELADSAIVDPHK
jgi:glutamate/tyrosine decarboxylase-like PLP-dependent enzyme